jgi:hypothetical protein
LALAFRTSSNLWRIPITLQSASGKKVQMVLDQRQASVAVDGISADEWIKVNLNQTGFYRVNYVDVDHWRKLAQAAQAQQLSAVDRLGLLDDVCQRERASERERE